MQHNKIFTYSITKKYSILLLIMLGMLCTGCTAAKQFGRELENTLGVFGTDNIQKIGSPQKEAYLTKRTLTGEYGVHVPGIIFHMGDEFNNVTVIKEYSADDEDFIILLCQREDGTIKNYLVAIPRNPSRTKIYNIESTSKGPFTFELTDRYVKLTQEVAANKTLDIWHLYSYSKIKGPARLDITPKTPAQTAKKAQSKPSTTSRSTSKPQTAATKVASYDVEDDYRLPPITDTDTSIRLERTDSVQIPKSEKPILNLE